MKIIQSMLDRLIESPNNILELTNRHIIEVDEFDMAIKATNLTVGHVLTCEAHPNSDHLHVTTVDVKDEVLQIVCGAPNVAKGQYVIVAKIGAVLGEDFEIKPTKIRGIESFGMICSLSELGIPKKHIEKEYQEGIFFFKEPVEVGSDPLKQLQIHGYKMMLGITPNRSDLLSHYGFAKDLATMTGKRVTLPAYNFDETLKNPYKVSIESDLGLQYHARYFENVEIKESPLWLKNALIQSDIEPINNVVDITNYVLMLYGTPLHAFDHELLEGNEIRVRTKNMPTNVVTLDGIEREVPANTLFICDAKKEVAIAGVMGLENTMITDKTTKVLLEAAVFNPESIKNTSKTLDLRSDSSLRFERGIDPTMPIEGMKLATKLLVELANARVSNIVSNLNNPYHPVVVTIKKDMIENRLGFSIGKEKLLSIFKAYNYEVKEQDNFYELTIPSYRNDITIDADVLEEVARYCGLDLIENQTLLHKHIGKLTDKQKTIRKIRHFLANQGLNEVINYSLVSEDDIEQYVTIGEAVSLLNPLSQDRKVLRQSLIKGLLSTVNYNQNRMQEDLFLFEIGHVFSKDREENRLAIALSNKYLENKWQGINIHGDYFVLKGLVEALFTHLNVEYQFEAANTYGFLHPYLQANIVVQNKPIGYLGKVHPKLAKKFDIDSTYVLELNLDLLCQNEISYKPISKYPSIERDIAFVVDQGIKASEIEKIIIQTVRKQLVSLRLFDQYQGENVEQGKKSLAYRLVFNDDTKTLESDEVDKLILKVTKRLQFEFKAIIRQ